MAECREALRSVLCNDSPTRIFRMLWDKKVLLSSLVIKMTSSGYSEINFLSELQDELKCLICLSVARQPWQHTSCGRLFCEDCLEEYRKEKDSCPYCRDETGQFFLDCKSNREIQGLQVRCKNSHLGCDWTGELRSMKEHCPFTKVLCPNECHTGNGEELFECLRQDLENHLKESCPKRQFTCPHCQEVGVYEEITTSHLKVCPEVITKCPNKKCNKQLPAKGINRHVEIDCKYTIMKCRYKNIGCNSRMLREYLESHENDDKIHLRVAMKTLAKQQEQLASAQKEIKLLKIKACLPVQFKMTDFERMKEEDEIFISPFFYSGPKGYLMQIKLYPNGIEESEDRGRNVSVNVVVHEGEYDDELKWPFAGTITLELLNQLADKDHHSKRMSIMEVGGVEETPATIAGFISHSKLTSESDSEVQYLKDDTIYLRVSFHVFDHKPWLECTL